MNAVPPPTEHEVDMITRRLIAAYDWQSVNREHLVARVVARLAAGAPFQEPYDLERLCQGTAAEQLYEACTLQPTTPAAQQRREAAYQDVGKYLLAVGPRQLSPPPPDVKWTQIIEDTLQEIYLTLTRRSDTSTFLGLALTILRRQRATSWKTHLSHSAREQSFDATVEGDTGSSTVSPLVESIHTRDPYQSVDPQGDLAILTILGQCLRTVEQRIIALGRYLGLKRREILLVFTDLPEKYDNLRRAVEKRLANCSRIRQLRDPEAPWVRCAVRDCPDPTGGTL